MTYSIHNLDLEKVSYQMFIAIALSKVPDEYKPISKYWNEIGDGYITLGKITIPIDFHCDTKVTKE